MHHWPIPSALRRIAVLAAVWWVLTDGELRSWVIGVPAVVLAARASLILRRGSPVRTWIHMSVTVQECSLDASSCGTAAGTTAIGIPPRVCHVIAIGRSSISRA